MITALLTQKHKNVPKTGADTWGHMNSSDIIKLAYNLMGFGNWKCGISIMQLYGEISNQNERVLSQKALEGVFQTLHDNEDMPYEKVMVNASIFMANRFINENHMTNYGAYDFNDLLKHFDEVVSQHNPGDYFYQLCCWIAFTLLFPRSVRNLVDEEYGVFSECEEHFIKKWVHGVIERIGGHGILCGKVVHNERFLGGTWVYSMMNFLIDTKEFSFIHTKDLRSATKIPSRRLIAVAGGLYLSDWLKEGQTMALPLPQEP